MVFTPSLTIVNGFCGVTSNSRGPLTSSAGAPIGGRLVAPEPSDPCSTVRPFGAANRAARKIRILSHFPRASIRIASANGTQNAYLT